MQKKFLTNLALLLFLNLLVKPFYIFGIDLTVQNVVGDIDYGFYFTIFNFSFALNILLDAGITNFNNRNIAQHHFLLNKHFSGIFILKMMLAILYSIFIFALALIIGYKGEQLHMLGWVAFNQFLLSLVMYLRSNVNGLLMFKTDSFLSVLDRLLMIIICGVLLWGHVTHEPFRIMWFVYVQTVSYSITAIIALVVVMRKARFRKFHWNAPFFIMILKKSFPFALLVLLMAVYKGFDTVFLERILKGELGSEQAGIYAHGFRLLDAANQIAFLFAVLLLPIYSRMIRLKQKLDEMIRLPFTILFTAGIILSVGSYFYSAEIMHLLYPRKPHESIALYEAMLDQSARVYSILMFCFLGTITMYVFSTLLTANGSLKQLNIIAFSGIVVNFTLNIILVPKMMATGSAMASLTTQLGTALAYLLMAQYLFRFKVNYKLLAVLALFAASVVVITYFSKQMPFNWVINLAAMVAISLIIAFSIRLISLRSLWKILKSREDTPSP